MSEEEFVAFVAPRLPAANGQATGEPPAGEPPAGEPPAGEPPANEPPADELRTGEQVAEESAVAESAREAAVAAEETSSVEVPPAAGPMRTDDRAPATLVTPCEHADQIRRQAIRLATIACGKALRRAALIHPGVIAAFVDDALAAAGAPGGARVRVHPVVAAQLSPGHEIIADGDLDRAAVFIESEGASVGADLDTRAGLLVRAAAHS